MPLDRPAPAVDTGTLITNRPHCFVIVTFLDHVCFFSMVLQILFVTVGFTGIAHRITGSTGMDRLQ